MAPTTNREVTGRDAFAAGRTRLVPRDLLVNEGTAATEAWYRGWDAANLAAPVEGWTDEENETYTRRMLAADQQQRTAAGTTYNLTGGPA